MKVSLIFSVSTCLFMGFLIFTDFSNFNFILTNYWEKVYGSKETINFVIFIIALIVLVVNIKNAINKKTENRKCDKIDKMIEIIESGDPDWGKTIYETFKNKKNSRAEKIAEPLRDNAG